MKRKGFYVELNNKPIFILHDKFYLKDNEARALMLKFNMFSEKSGSIENFKMKLQRANLYQSEGGVAYVQIGRGKHTAMNDIEIIRGDGV